MALVESVSCCKHAQANLHTPAMKLTMEISAIGEEKCLLLGGALTSYSSHVPVGEKKSKTNSGWRSSGASGQAGRLASLLREGKHLYASHCQLTFPSNPLHRCQPFGLCKCSVCVWLSHIHKYMYSDVRGISMFNAQVVRRNAHKLGQTGSHQQEPDGPDSRQQRRRGEVKTRLFFPDLIAHDGKKRNVGI